MSNRRYIAFVLIPIFLLCYSAVANLPDEIIEERLRLTSILDSIELEKQNLKRVGKSLKQLDERSKSVRDSIEGLREEMPLVATDFEEKKEEATSKIGLKLFAPESLIDWVILFAGAVAVLSGVVLIFGIFTSLFKKKKKNSNLVANQRSTTLSERLSVNKKVSSTSRAVDLQESTNSDMNFLREKIRAGKESSSVQSESPFARVDTVLAKESTPPTPSQPSQPVFKNNTSESVGQSSIQNSIIAEYQSGVSEQEISKKYQISLDQVALIVRVANQNRKL